MTDHTPIRTRADGSIDTDHYIAQGRRARSERAHAVSRFALRAGIATALASTAAIAGIIFFPLRF